MEHLVYQQGYSYSYGGSTTKKNNLCKKTFIKEKKETTQELNIVLTAR